MFRNYKYVDMFGKGLLIGIVVCFIGASALFFIDTQVSVIEKVKLNKSSFYVLEEIVDLKKFQKWDPRAIKDSLISVEFIGTPGLGMKAVTKGKKGLFINEYEVINIKPLESVEIILRLKGGNKLFYHFDLENLENGSELSWSVAFKAPLFVTLVGVEEKIKNEFKEGFVVLKNRLNSSY